MGDARVALFAWVLSVSPEMCYLVVQFALKRLLFREICSLCKNACKYFAFLEVLTSSKCNKLGRLCRNNETKFHLLGKSAPTLAEALRVFQNDIALNVVPL